MNPLDAIPHEGAMLLLDEVVRVEATRIETRVTIREDHLFIDETGAVPGLVAIEFFAQSAAALMAHRSQNTDATPMSGALLGARKIDLSVAAFNPGDELTVVAEEVWGAGQLAQFDCRVELQGKVVATASINVAAFPTE